MIPTLTFLCFQYYVNQTIQPSTSGRQHFTSTSSEQNRTAFKISSSGLTHVITMDLHAKEIQGFFDIPVENLRASPFLIDYIEKSVCYASYNDYYAIGYRSYRFFSVLHRW